MPKSSHPCYDHGWDINLLHHCNQMVASNPLESQTLRLPKASPTCESFSSPPPLFGHPKPQAMILRAGGAGQASAGVRAPGPLGALPLSQVSRIFNPAWQQS